MTHTGAPAENAPEALKRLPSARTTRRPITCFPNVRPAVPQPAVR